MATNSEMTPADLRAWQAHMDYTFAQAAQALGVSQSAYADWLAGVSRTTGKTKEIDKRTALACAALAAGLGEWYLCERSSAQDATEDPR